MFSAVASLQVTTTKPERTESAVRRSKALTRDGFALWKRDEQGARGVEGVGRSPACSQVVTWMEWEEYVQCRDQDDGSVYWSSIVIGNLVVVNGLQCGSAGGSVGEKTRRRRMKR